MEIIDRSIPIQQEITIEISERKFTLTPEQLSVRYPNLHKHWENHSRPQVLTLDKNRVPDTFARYLETGQIPDDYKLSSDDHDHLSLSIDFTTKLADRLRHECTKTRLFSASRDGDVNEWDLTTGKCVRTFSGQFIPRTIAVLGNRLYIGRQSSIEECDLKEGSKTFVGKATSALYTIVVHGKYLYGGSFSGTIPQWNIKKANKYVKSFNGHNDIINEIAVRHNKLYSASSDSTIKVWDIDTGKCLQTIKCESIARSIKVCGSFLFSGHENGEVIEWLISDKVEKLRNITGHKSGSINTIAVQGTQLYGGTDLGSIYQWDLNTGECRNIDEFDASVKSIVVSGDRLCSGHENGTIREWNLTTGELIIKIDGHTDSVLQIVFG